MKTLITGISDGQKKQIKRFAEDAVDSAIAEGLLDKDKAQKLIGNDNKFKVDIIASIKKYSVSNQFSDEEVESSYGYLSGYRPKQIREQVEMMARMFELDPNPTLDWIEMTSSIFKLPNYAEGLFAIPKWQSVAKTYNEAVQKVLDLIKQTQNGKLYNYREGKLDLQYLRQHERTIKNLKTLTNQQEGHDILVVPAQFGLRHRGRSVRRAREVFAANEFGLGVFEIGCMLLTHLLERLKHFNDLWIDCAGDEYAPDGAGDFSFAPYFSFHDGWIEFSTRWLDRAGSSYGSASGFLPQTEF